MNYCKIFLFTIINVAIGSVPELSPNTFLFCLKPEIAPLEISLNRGRLSVGLPGLDDFFQSHEVVKIEPWIKHAAAMDRDGDIYLNRIYRIYIDGNSLGRITNPYYPFRISPIFYMLNPNIFENHITNQMTQAILASAVLKLLKLILHGIIGILKVEKYRVVKIYFWHLWIPVWTILTRTL